MQWHYIDSDQKRQPFDATALGDLVKNGTIESETLLWNESMDDWQAASSLFPAWFPEGEKSKQPPDPIPGGDDLIPAVSPDGSPPITPTPAPTPEPEAAQPEPERSPRVDPGPGKVIHTLGTPAAPDSNLREAVRDFASYLNANRGWIKFIGVLSIIQGAVLCIGPGVIIGWLPIWLGVTLFRAATAARMAESTGDALDFEEAIYRLGFFFKLSGIVVISIVSFFIVVVIVLISTGLFSKLLEKIQVVG